jgi:hypothetical protein
MSLKLNTPDQRYTDSIGQIIENKEAYAGQRAIHKAGVKYLTPLSNMDLRTREGLAEYGEYKGRTLFPNFVSKTVEGMTGLIFRKAPVNKLPKQLEYMLKNATATGKSIKDVEKKISTELMLTDCVGVKVSLPQADKSIVSALDAEKKNIRPYLTIHEAEDVIKVFYDIYNNIEMISLVVLREKTVDKSKEFNRKIEFNYTVLDLVDFGDELPVYRERRYDKNCVMIKDSEIFPMIQGEFFNEIPFRLSDINGGTKAPVEDLTKANINYYKMNGPYTDGVYRCGFAVPTVTGVAPESVPTAFGPSEILFAESKDAKFGMLESTAGGADKAERFLKNLENLMAALGANMLNPSKMVAETAESKKLDHQSQASVLSMVSDTTQDTVQWAVDLCAKWMGIKETKANEAKITLNKDYFPSEMSPQMFKELLAAVSAGKISYETFWENLQKGEIASANKTAEQEQDDIDVADQGLDL